VTLALKNLVGINGDKNWLPHHSLGSLAQGGDEFPGEHWSDRLRSRATEIARPWLDRGRGLSFFRMFRRTEIALRGDDFLRAGNWYGNRTCWRMCMDLNRCLYFSDAKGPRFDAPAPVRSVLTVLDGIVAGEGAGPLSPSDRPLGIVLAATDPLALDLAAVRLMGFDEAKIPKLRESMQSETLRVTQVRHPDQVQVMEVSADTFAGGLRGLDELRCETPFTPHAGWRGHIERGAP